MKRVSLGIAAFGFVLLTGSTAQAQSGAAASQQEAPMTNLQVWPKDTPRAQVIQTMQAFNSSLGITCNYCHVQGPDGKMDFASDAKREKIVARQMILLRDSINVLVPAIVGKRAGIGPTSGMQGYTGEGAPVRVLCSSCHRGLPVPKAIAEFITEAEGANGGATAGLAKFRELREKFFGGQTFDFTDQALLTIAQRAVTAKRPDDAIAYLQANIEYWPRSARTYQALAQVRNSKGDKAGAIRDLEKAVELDPANAQAKTQLAQLKGQ
jgi:hypothetical protein